MFDVVWTDHNRELVGERILRKELEAKEKDKRKLESGRQSVSTTSSSSSERGFGLFASRSKRKTPTPAKGRGVGLTTGQVERDDFRGSRNSSYGVRSLLSVQDEADVTPKPIEGPFLALQFPEPPGESVSSPSSRDSMLSKWTQQSAATTGILAGTSTRDSIATSKSENLIQTLGPSSFITKNTEVTISARTSETDIDQLISEISISSDRIKAETPPLPDMPESLLSEKDTNAQDSKNDDPGQQVLLAPKDADSRASPYRAPQTPPPLEVRTHNNSHHPGNSDNDRLGNPDAWKPPHEWDCTPTKAGLNSSGDERLRTSPASPELSHYMSPDLLALQREIRMMSAASPELMLANMKSGMGEGSDAFVYKELEMTKKRWMFSALHQHSGYAALIERRDNRPESPTTGKPPKILALYETQASASFLAALHPFVSLTHLSPNPISPRLFPNVQPILVPAVSASAGSRPLPPRLYSTVTCLSMPALFPSTEIPPFLRHISRCLTPGGALQLTLIDPQPVSASMGPKLRQWLFDNLLINLEQVFRTTYPSETFPAWLGISHLRGKGSTIASLSVPAVPECLPKIDGMKEQDAVKVELRCLATRMLWQEVWGSFVHAKRWWWEEEEIVQECAELGTYWQYNHIVAVKED
ncbi:hypothetical protein F4780DRAFT_778140 [Xylariomycetidae sp. FL0641]|nr:hypothetical protein F4780DRAFT_778140 [Xylariomycetidae sp. FL0641]